MTSPRIKSCDQGANPELLRFLDKHLPFTYDASVFEWEYGHVDKTFCYLESDEGQILGAQGMIPVELDLGPRTLRTAKSETSYLAQEAQGQGLFSKLYKKTVELTQEKGLELIWGFTALGPIWQRLGFRVQNDCLLNCEIQLKAGAIPKDFFKLRRWLGYLNSARLAFKTSASNKKIAAQLASKNFSYNEDNLTSGNIQALHQEMRDAHPSLVLLDLNEDYFKQRISENPFINYAFGSITDTGGHLLGYYILAAKPGEKSAYISNVTAVNKEVKTLLISKAISRVKALDTFRTLQVFGNKHNSLMKETFDLLDQFGVRKIDSGMYLVVKPLSDEECAKEHDFANWHINGLWTEGITQ